MPYILHGHVNVTMSRNERWRLLENLTAGKQNKNMIILHVYLIGVHAVFLSASRKDISMRVLYNRIFL